MTIRLRFIYLLPFALVWAVLLPLPLYWALLFDGALGALFIGLFLAALILELTAIIVGVTFYDKEITIELGKNREDN